MLSRVASRAVVRGGGSSSSRALLSSSSQFSHPTPSTRQFLNSRLSAQSLPRQSLIISRYQSTTVPNPNNPPSTGSSGPSSGSSGALAGGLAGGAAAFLLGYLWYHFSGAKTVIRTSKKTQAYLASAKEKAKAAAPDVDANQALDWLRDTALTYSAVVPGAKKYVNAAFDDLDRIREKHGDEVESAVKDAYTDLRDVVSKEGVSFESAQQAYEVLSRFAQRVGDLAGDAAEQILENHPQLKEKLGGSVDQLKNLGDTYGPQVKSQIDDTWGQVKDIAKSGTGPDAIKKIQKLVQEKIQDIKRGVDQAWKKGMEQAKPYLDRNPKAKQLIEENQDALKNGDFTKLWGLVKDASSGNTEELEKYVKDKAQNAKGAGMESWDQLLQMIPGGEQLGPKVKTLQELAQKRGKDAEKLLKETVEELQHVLSKKTDEAKELADKASKET